MNTTETGWRPVPGYEDIYEIHPDGIVRSCHHKTKGHVISKHICRNYITVKLTRNRKGSTQNLHRLLALAFVANPQNKPIVNHINGCKLDNRIENLEWVTHSENVRHAMKLKLITFRKRPVFNLCTNTLYPSIWKAAVENGIGYNALKSFLNGSQKNTTCLRLVA